MFFLGGETGIFFCSAILFGDVCVASAGRFIICLGPACLDFEVAFVFSGTTVAS